MLPKSDPRFDRNPYLEWVHKEGLRVSEGMAINLFEVETAPWPRYGVKGAAVHCTGRGEEVNMFVLDIPAGGSSAPLQHMYEEIYFVLDGRGSTQLEFSSGRKHSFEWGPRSFFGIPLNAKHRHFNGSGTQRALLVETTTLPMIMNIFHNEQFIFETPGAFQDREGPDRYYQGEGDLHLLKPGYNMWETNFVHDLIAQELTPWEERGKGSGYISFVLGDGIMHAHMSEVAPATYKKAHRHSEGIHVLTLTGGGYSLLWYPGDTEFERVEWSFGVVFPPCEMQFHQHFVTSERASRYVATGIGNLRYPFSAAKRRQKAGIATSLKDGGNQIEYQDQDPRIHQIWLEEMHKRGITPQLTL